MWGMKDWRKRLLVVGVAGGLQALILGIALVVGVMETAPVKEATFKASGDTRTEALEARQAMREAVAELDRLQAQGADAVEMALLEAMAPELPEVGELVPSAAMAGLGSLLPTTGLTGPALGTLEGLGEQGNLPELAPVAFLGEELNAQRIVLLLDVSGSVKTKMERGGLPMQRLREEVTRFIGQLGPNHLFGIVQFTRKWDPFKEELVPATEVMKAEARAWMQTSFRTSGTSGSNWRGGYPNGIEAVLMEAFRMDPELDEIVLVSDGDFQRTPPGGGGQDVSIAALRNLTRQLQEEMIGQTRLNLLCFYPPPSAVAALRAWARENGEGRFTVRPEGAGRPPGP
jgi:hypothetical protein